MSHAQPFQLQTLIRYWPALAALVVLIGTAYVANYRLDAQAQEMDSIEMRFEGDIDSVEAEQRNLRQTQTELREDQIRQEGKTALAVQELQNDVEDIGEKIDLLIRLQRGTN